MNVEQLRTFCLGLPGATEDVKWGNDLCFSIGSKMFCVTGVDANEGGISFKCTPEVFGELVERDGIIPAHYVARYHWVTVEKMTAVSQDELKELINNSYQLVLNKLPKKLRDSIPGL
ncbi:MAG: MmcQ/YjbR family DNA-binding protein [Pyrinomonadaceae bacterium]